MDAPQIVILLVVGLSVGSFLNVCVHRIPRRQSVVSPGSRCPRCGYALRWFDNIPLVSYLLLRGKCRRCRGRISVRYPALEAVTALLFLAHGAVFGWTALLAARLLLAVLLVALFAIDFEHQLLPDALTLPGMVAGLALSLALPPGIAAAVLGLLVGGGILWLIGEAYYRLTGQEGMGGGDVKMLAMIGAFLGWKLALLTLVLSSFAGSIVGLAVIVGRRGGMKHALPYGTFLALGALVASLGGEELIAWYFGLY